ncbi:MAG: VOC family protein [Candidatus Eremiobacteraeota bacterium]|nr:VOC family protein [Candidatus Eremiobacteraeota bacterium]
MILNHVNLSVPEVEVTAAFFEEHFGLRRVAERAGMLAVLCDEASTVLTLSNFYKDTEVAYPRGFHMGFLQQTREQVDAIYERLHAAGYAHSAPRTVHGTWGFYFDAPGGVQVEISVRMS